MKSFYYKNKIPGHILSAAKLVSDVLRGYGNDISYNPCVDTAELVKYVATLAVSDTDLLKAVNITDISDNNTRNLIQPLC